MANNSCDHCADDYVERAAVEECEECGALVCEYCTAGYVCRRCSKARFEEQYLHVHRRAATSRTRLSFALALSRFSR